MESDGIEASYTDRVNEPPANGNPTTIAYNLMLYTASDKIIPLEESVKQHLWLTKDDHNIFYIIPFKIGRMENLQKCYNILEAVYKFNSYKYNGRLLPIKFKEITGNLYPDSYVEFIDNKNGGTNAYTYKQRGKNEVNIGLVFEIHDILHEMMHVIGFEHEHQAYNRRLNNIQLGNGPVWSGNLEDFKEQVDLFQNNVVKIKGIPITPYDKYSIMHYPCDNIYLKAEPTSTEKPTELTQDDCASILILYGRPICTGLLFRNRPFCQSYVICAECNNKKYCVSCGFNHNKNHKPVLMRLDQSPSFNWISEWELNNDNRQRQIPVEFIQNLKEGFNPFTFECKYHFSL